MDIVERLRSASIYNPHEAENLCEKAADKIERLRDALQTIAEEGSGWGQSVALAALKESK